LRNVTFIQTPEADSANPARVLYEENLRHGLMLQRAGKLKAAQARFEDAIELQPDSIEANLALADLLVQRGNPAGAAPRLEKARAVAEHDQDRLAQARAFFRLGAVRFALKEFAAAQQANEQAQKLYQLLNDQEGQSKVLLQIGKFYASAPAPWTDNQRAVSILKECATKALETGDKVIEGRSLAALYRLTDDPKTLVAARNLLRAYAPDSTDFRELPGSGILQPNLPYPGPRRPNSPFHQPTSGMAVVIGINKYAHLDNANLEGCVNDAGSIKKSLERRGFRVIAMTNAEATREGILSKLHELATIIRPDERFVFYFAGHGSHDAAYRCMLLASDAEETNTDHVLYKEDLQGALQAINARSRTVLLDACHSEGLLRGKGTRFTRNRFHQLRLVTRSGKSKRLPSVNETDNNNEILGDGLCGFTACTRQQPSGERQFDDGEHGVFTHYLTAHLAAHNADEPWDDLVTDVSSHVAEEMDQQQTPVFAPNIYRKVRVFDARDGKKPEPKPDDRTLWDDYVDNKANPAYLRVSFSLGSDVKSVKQGTAFSVKLSAGKSDGYLIVLNKDASNAIYLMSPNPDKGGSPEEMVDRARIRANVTRTIETRGQDIGTERVKAILFRNREDALEIIKKFPKGSATPEQLKREKRARMLPPGNETDDTDPSDKWTFYTSMIQVDVTNKDAKDDNDDAVASLLSDHIYSENTSHPGPPILGELDGPKPGGRGPRSHCSLVYGAHGFFPIGGRAPGDRPRDEADASLSPDAARIITSESLPVPRPLYGQVFGDGPGAGQRKGETHV